MAGCCSENEDCVSRLFLHKEKGATLSVAFCKPKNCGPDQTPCTSVAEFKYPIVPADGGSSTVEFLVCCNQNEVCRHKGGDMPLPYCAPK
ncbi:MAG: hypothetical protein QW273_03230 [Candidatus Pacearchaeota archaeon]